MKPLYTYFENSALSFPQQPAIRVGGEVFSYDTLRDGAEKAAHNLKDMSGEVVAVFASKQYISYTTILGTLASGNVYCPLNPKFPQQRNAEIIRLSKAAVLAGDEADEGFNDLIRFVKQASPGLILSESTAHGLRLIRLDQKQESPLTGMAYLLFTSGTTGRPKGVLISNIQVGTYLENIRQHVRIAQGANCSHTFDLTFDLSIHDLFVTWSAGACLCVPAESDLLSPARYIKEQAIDAWFSVPSLVAMMRKLRQLKAGNLTQLNTALFCGEALPYALLQELKQAAPAAQVFNLYGPTEATIAISAFDATHDTTTEGIVPLGKIFEQNAHRVSEEGELLLRGAQVITDYYTPDNEGRFIDGWYRSGDLVQESAEGLRFRGRLDEQIKFRGYRIELREIEYMAATYLQATASVCLAISESGEVKHLALVIESRPDEALKADLLVFLRSMLPAYMVPESIRFVEKFPLNVNGKTDKKAILELLK